MTAGRGFRPGLLVGAALLAMVVFVAKPSPASACSTAPPFPIGDVLAAGRTQPGQTVTGVYEQRQIAWVPSLLFFRSARSASVVDRYWGDEPSLGVAVHGEGSFGSGECGNGAQPRGETTLGVTIAESPFRRQTGTGISLGDQPMADIEADLAAAFGDPVEVGAGLGHYVVAYALLLWLPAVAIGALAAIAVVGKLMWTRRGRVTDLKVPT